MPREIITVQVGQCGNQIGLRFWELALREHARHNPEGVYDDAFSTFFKNVDERFQPPINLPVGDGASRIRSVKARAVVVDMEEGVINDMLKSPLGEVLDATQLISDVSGAGNNWAHGHHGYGPRYRDALCGQFQRAAEACDSLQSCLLLHSLGGGTGSGLGTYILGLLEEELPDAFRFAASVFPSEDDHVVTSPYNAVLAADQLLQHADCCLPLENQALLGICARLEAAAAKAPLRTGSAISGVSTGYGKAAKPWDAMNGIAANMLLALTASVRFAGPLNTDLNDIIMNLVPFPRQHFLLSSLAPLALPKDLGRAAAPRSVDQLFTDAFNREQQLIWADPKLHTALATALLARGNVTISDMHRNVTRMQPTLKMAYWNPNGFKVGICATPAAGAAASLLCLSNNCAIAGTLRVMTERFRKLYKRRIFVHHYEEYMERAGFDEALEHVGALADAYEAADRATPPPTTRMAPRGPTACNGSTP